MRMQVIHGKFLILTLLLYIIQLLVPNKHFVSLVVLNCYLQKSAMVDDIKKLFSSSSWIVFASLGPRTPKLLADVLGSGSHKLSNTVHCTAFNCIQCVIRCRQLHRVWYVFPLRCKYSPYCTLQCWSLHSCWSTSLSAVCCVLDGSY